VRNSGTPTASSIPGDPALTIGCVKGGEAINVVTSKTPLTQAIGKSDTAEWGELGKFQAGVAVFIFSAIAAIAFI
jgi:hypothetical protein